MANNNRKKKINKTSKDGRILKEQINTFEIISMNHRRKKDAILPFFYSVGITNFVHFVTFFTSFRTIERIYEIQ